MFDDYMDWLIAEGISPDDLIHGVCYPVDPYEYGGSYTPPEEELPF